MMILIMMMMTMMMILIVTMTMILVMSIVMRRIMALMKVMVTKAMMMQDEQRHLYEFSGIINPQRALKFRLTVWKSHPTLLSSAH